jgi:hypothetical protein
MKLVEQAIVLTEKRKNQDEDYNKFIKSRRFKKVKNFFKKEIKRAARLGYGNIQSDAQVQYLDDGFNSRSILLSDNEFEYLERYYSEEGFYIDLSYTATVDYRKNPDNEKHNNIRISWALNNF